ncbi:Inositol-pentakisphosphate 2-kinase [Thelohanellus kitauei]|uniref:Inositol-pentakisphosphate 2-kinase n=1 Tax=Thelohanellus kitauei TaxID=669202 RepID=A0A0C2JYE7_THEKT|nr:Inositol-pentakisphosphate 2-kinase [Thelohanellus kitauei]
MNIRDLTNSTYLADGNNNVVFRVHSTSHVLRFYKFVYLENENSEKLAIDEKCNIYSSQDVYNFHLKVIRKLLPEAYLLPDFYLIRPDLDLSNHVIKEFNSSKFTRREALLMNDVIRLLGPEPVSYLIEIKPKLGFISPIGPSCHTYESKYCRFCLQQLSKIKENVYEVHKDNQYCPLDLFFTCHNRIRFALDNLFKFPQNNLKIYINGMYRDLTESGIEEKNFLTQLIFLCILEDSRKNETSTNITRDQTCSGSHKFDCCLNNTCKHRPTGGVLDLLLSFQRLDAVGLNTISQMWSLMDEKSKKQAIICLEDFDHPIWKDINPFNSDNDTRERTLLIRNFLLSMTFRDASLTFTIRENNDKLESCGLAHSTFVYGEHCFDEVLIKD